jgi:hypothetical protein
MGLLGVGYADIEELRRYFNAKLAAVDAQLAALAVRAAQPSEAAIPDFQPQFDHLNERIDARIRNAKAFNESVIAMKAELEQKIDNNKVNGDDFVRLGVMKAQIERIYAILNEIAQKRLTVAQIEDLKQKLSSGIKGEEYKQTLAKLQEAKSQS